MRNASIVLAAVASALMAATGAVADEALELSQARWSDAAPGHYVYAYQKYCECHRDTPPSTFVEVDDGVVVRVYHVHEESDREVPAREGSLDLYWTFDDLLDLLAAAGERGTTYRGSYDDALGYPTQVFIDYDPGYIGEELDIRVTSFELLD